MSSRDSTTISDMSPSSAKPNQTFSSPLLLSRQQNHNTADTVLHDTITKEMLVPGSFYHVSLSGYQSALQLNTPFVILFHAKWCGPCRHTYPKYKAAAAINRHLPFLAIEYDELIRNGKDVLQKLEITGFPTIRIVYNHKQWRDYEGERSEQAFSQLRP